MKQNLTQCVRNVSPAKLRGAIDETKFHAVHGQYASPDSSEEEDGEKGAAVAQTLLCCTLFHGTEFDRSNLRATKSLARYLSVANRVPQTAVLS